MRKLSTRGLAACLTVSTLTLPNSAEAQSPPPEVRPPQVVDRVDAVYPRSELAQPRHADVVLNVTVDSDGHVTKADVIESGGADMDEAARAAVLQWTFHPARRAGQPVASRIRVPFHFAPPTESAAPVPAAVPVPVPQPAPAPQPAPVNPTPTGASPAPKGDTGTSSAPTTPSSDT